MTLSCGASTISFVTIFDGNIFPMHGLGTEKGPVAKSVSKKLMSDPRPQPGILGCLGGVSQNTEAQYSRKS